MRRLPGCPLILARPGDHRCRDSRRYSGRFLNYLGRFLNRGPGDGRLHGFLPRERVSDFLIRFDSRAETGLRERQVADPGLQVHWRRPRMRRRGQVGLRLPPGRLSRWN
ncbi:hypothetical protein [Actinoplanes sp. NPDC051859]|uniref:hypothetical protein n=1 Tax=Actinoplanes sp. NPDC051859 TaxID=3363909 RepID=UPI00379E8057